MCVCVRVHVCVYVCACVCVCVHIYMCVHGCTTTNRGHALRENVIGKYRLKWNV